MTTLYDFSLTDIDGAALPLDRFRGKPILLVNVASKCGLTPQYTGLEALYRKYKDRGFVLLGLPCNQFGGQEPGTETEIKTFCQSRYDVSFPLSGKIDVNGPGRHALYEWLAGASARFPGNIGWNFEKFLVDGQGAVAERFGPRTTPEDEKLVAAVEHALA